MLLSNQPVLCSDGHAIGKRQYAAINDHHKTTTAITTAFSADFYRGAVAVDYKVGFFV